MAALGHRGLYHLGLDAPTVAPLLHGQAVRAMSGRRAGPLFAGRDQPLLFTDLIVHRGAGGVGR